MKINKKSWHYKMLFFWKDYRISKMPKSLCSYFWQIVGYILYSVIIGLTAVICAFFATSPIWGNIARQFMELDPGLSKVTTIFSYLYLGMAGIAGIYYIYKLTRKIKSTNIFFDYLAARKEKICPLIEYGE